MTPFIEFYLQPLENALCCKLKIKHSLIMLYAHRILCNKNKFSPLYWSSLFNRLDGKLFLYHWMTFRTQTTTHYVYYFFSFASVGFCVYIIYNVYLPTRTTLKKNMCWVPANQTVLLMIQGCAMSWRRANYKWNSCMFSLVGAISPHEQTFQTEINFTNKFGFRKKKIIEINLFYQRFCESVH